MRLFSLVWLLIGLAGGPALADTYSCRTVIEHTETDTSNPWQTVNDGVMGGRSSGGSNLQSGTLVFAGVTNTNGGGFSSIRMRVPRGTLTGADHLKVHMKRDARDYAMTLRTNVRSFGRRIAFRGPLSGTPEGNWGDAVLSFESLRASIWGRGVRGAVFDPGEVVEIGLIIYDGRDGPFEMELKRIEACSLNAQTHDAR